MTTAEHKPEQIIIEPPHGWQAINLRELYHYRDLFYFLVRRDVMVIYKQTILGFAWAVIRPLVSMIIFTIIFGNIARVSSDGVPYVLFSYTALVPWTYFSASFTTSTASLVSNQRMLSKVYFPRLVFPLTPAVAKLVDFVIAFAVLLLLMLVLRQPPTWAALALPYLVFLLFICAAGAGMWLSALAVQYRDVNHAMSFLTQLLMYAAPVVWPVSALTERFGETARLLYGLYPMVGIIEGFRASLLNTTPMPWDLIAVGSLSAFILFISGAYYFKHTEAIFADVA